MYFAVLSVRYSRMPHHHRHRKRHQLRHCQKPRISACKRRVCHLCWCGWRNPPAVSGNDDEHLQGTSGTGVFSDVYDYRVCLANFLEQFETVVSGFFIVSDDDFEVLIGLGKEVIEGCFNEFSGVVCRDDDADETCGWIHVTYLSVLEVEIMIVVWISYISSCIAFLCNMHT